MVTTAVLMASHSSVWRDADSSDPPAARARPYTGSSSHGCSTSTPATGIVAAEVTPASAIRVTMFRQVHTTSGLIANIVTRATNGSSSWNVSAIASESV